MDSVDFDKGAANEGLVKRRALAAKSSTFDVMGRLHADIFFQERYTLNAIGVKIKLVKTKMSSV